jgi:carboxyl-terminal processing protease
MPLRNLVWLLVVPGLVGLGLVIGASAPAPDKDYQLVRQVVEVLAEVDANFVRELNDDERQKLVEDMINGGLHKLDPHSVYLNVTQLKQFETESEGSYTGIGILLGGFDPKTKYLRVEYPMPGGPAYEAGVLANDQIARIGEVSTAGMTGEEARKRILGEPGSKITLTFRREGHNPLEFPLEVTRGRIPSHTVSGVSRRGDDPNKWNWFVDPTNKIAFVRIRNYNSNDAGFNERTAKELEAALKEIEEAGGRGLVIDLRDNPGGLLTQAIEVSDLLLTEGTIVTTKDRHGGEKHYKAKSKGTMFLPAAEKPIAVIINGRAFNDKGLEIAGGSASASEIVAAALQDNHRAAIAGERSYGKGSVQSLFRLAPDQKTAVKLTTQTWWRPSGKNMDRLGAPKEHQNEWGVTPDSGLDVSISDTERLRLEFEVEKLKFVAGRPDLVGPNPPKSSLQVPKKDGKPMWDESKPFDDRQLNRALDHIKSKLSGHGAAPAGGAPAERGPA